MKLFKKLRKGFTLIELVVVIAVIAILTAVSIVSYVSITNKAKQSNDQQKVDQLNLSLQAAEITEKPQTMSKALEALEEDGFAPEKFKAEAKNYRFAYSLEANRFVILEKGEKVVYPAANKGVLSADIWKFAASNEDVKADGASYYLMDGCSGDIEVEVNGGVDVGKNKDITSFKLKSSQKYLVVNSGGDQCTVYIDCGSSDVDFHGFAKRVDAKAVADQSLHIYGSVAVLAIQKGHAQVESTGIVFDVYQLGKKEDFSGATLTNNGFVASTSYDYHRQDPEDHTSALVPTTKPQTSGKGASDVYEIGSLEQLEAFRDTVNAGNSFEKLTVKLTKDIALNNGWQPIGEGTRQIMKNNIPATGTMTFFKGTFDGQNHTISNLNNKGFNPSTLRLATTNPQQYSYGLFALVDGAKIKDLKLTNVDIDGSRYSGAELDSVGALVGFAKGSIVIENITVSGSVKGKDAVAGVVGRSNAQDAAVVIKDCVNQASIVAYGDGNGSGQGVAAGVIRFYEVKGTGTVTINHCSNSGSVSCTSAAYKGAGIAAFESGQTLATLLGTNTDRGETITALGTRIIGTGK